MTGNVSVLLCALGTILVGPTHAVPRAFPWEATSPRTRLCDPSGAPTGRARPLAHGNPCEVAQPGPLLYCVVFSGDEVRGVGPVTHARPIVVLFWDLFHCCSRVLYQILFLC